MGRTLPQVNRIVCNLCGLCIEVCPCGSVELQQQGPVFACPDVCARAEGDFCNCGCLCEEICPTGAIHCAYEIVLGEGEGA